MNLLLYSIKNRYFTKTVLSKKLSSNKYKYNYYFIFELKLC